MKREKRHRKSHERSKDCPAYRKLQEKLMGSMQHQLQEVEKRRHDLMSEHQKMQKRSQKIQSIQDRKREYCFRKCCGTRRDAKDQRGH